VTTPPKLKKGDEIRVIAPSSSMSWLSEDTIKHATKSLEKEGFIVSFSENCLSTDSVQSSSISKRIADIHQAFSDKSVKAIYSVIGGSNANQLLSYLDYGLIKQNPKILCGYSDITALQNAITAKTGLVTYSGLHFSTWGMQKEFDYNLEYFKKCLMDNKSFDIKPSDTWSDDAWFEDQINRTVIKNEGFWILNKGTATGTIYGGNLCTFNLLQGTEYMPKLSDSILFLEDDALVGNVTAQEIDRNLQSLIHLPKFKQVKGIVFGRFQKKSKINIKKLMHIIKSKQELANIPIIANVDFGHTNPLITFPIGGTIEISAGETASLRVIEH